MARIASSGRGIFLWADLPESMDTIGIFDFVFNTKNFDYPEKTLKYKHIRRISD